VTELSPLFDLRLRTPRLELRLGTPEEIDELGRLARRGIHPAEEMPFGVAWSDRIGEPTFPEEFRAYHAALLASWKPHAWKIDFLVWEHHVLVGAQGISSENFSTERTVATGSWLGAAHQGRGVGTEMRVAMLELGFRGLGANAATSGWLEGNRASARVSEKLGYREVGVSEISPRGVPVPHHDLRLERADWVAPVSVEITGLEAALPLFGL
jgi:RimJ/RimL family protein N-acetyltransferase